MKKKVDTLSHALLLFYFLARGRHPRAAPHRPLVREQYTARYRGLQSIL
jgi:hypothetical protein